VEADLRLTVDRTGSVFIPKVGRVTVSGVRNDSLQKAIELQAAKRFKGFELTVSVGRLHGIRVYVTGFAGAPGAYTLGSLSTLVNAVIAAGGPGPGGSFRSIELRRGASVVTHLDLYDLLIFGDKSRDVTLQSEDVVYIGPSYPQVAIFGSINRPGIFEIRPGETVKTLLSFAGGLNSVADGRRIMAERMSMRAQDLRQEFPMSVAGDMPLERADIVRVFSAVDFELPNGRQATLVRIDGEVNRPGDYLMPPGSKLSDLFAIAGGTTGRAFPFGTEFTRASVRKQQEEGYSRALQEFEATVTRNALTMRASSPEEVAQRSMQLDAVAKLVSRLREQKPVGRIIMAIKPDAPAFPDYYLENGDRLLIPPIPATVQVYGAVFSPGSYAFVNSTTIQQYLSLAGSVRREADRNSIFIVRADGSVRSNQQSGSVEKLEALPGDVVFVPDEMNRTTFMQDLKDVGSILFNFALGAAAFKVLLGF
jgi:protein involved in polysaccharide export with SLBB domain